MSTRADILAARDRYNDHNGVHGCRPGCTERARLWLAYMRTAELWYREPGDDERQRHQSELIT